MTEEKNRPHKSASQLRHETDRKLLKLVVLTLIMAGGGVILLVYGGWGLAAAVPVLLAGTFLIVVPYSVMVVLQKWRDKTERDAWEEMRRYQEQSKKLPPD